MFIFFVFAVVVCFEDDYDQLLHVKNIQILKANFSYRGFSLTAIDNLVYLIGGQDNNQEFSDKFFSYDISSDTIQQLSIEGDKFSARRAHVSVRYGNFIVIFGGVGEDQYYNDVYHFYPFKNYLKKIQVKNFDVPALANAQGILAEDKKIYFFGGFSLKGLSNQILVYDVVGQQFQSPIVFGTLPSPREFFAMSFLKQQIFVFGGYTNGGSLNDFYQYDIVQSRWQKISVENEELPLRNQKANLFVLNDNLVLFGGCNYKLSKCNNSFYEFDTAKKTFTEFYIDKEFNISETQGVLQGSTYLAFNNCQFEQQCTNNVYKIKFQFQSKDLECNKNGILKNDSRCYCFFGFYGNTCSYKNDCYFLNCSLNEFCSLNENCVKICSEIDCSNLPLNQSISSTNQSQPICLNNCTSRTNGVCQMNGLCLCTPKWTQVKQRRRLLDFKRLFSICIEQTNSRLRGEIQSTDLQNVWV